MKVTLYAAAHQQRWQWRISLDMRVDLPYWFQGAGSPVLLWLEPQISLGHALVWRQALSEQWSGFDAAQLNNVSNLFLRQIHQLEKDFRIGLSKAESLVNQNTADRWKCKLLFANDVPAAENLTDVETRNGHFGLSSLSLNKDAVMLLGARMQGRSLLVEEAISLLEHSGVPEFKEQWKSCVQAAYLQGSVELRNGMSRSLKRTFPFMPRKHEYQCRRCGSGNEKLRWTNCAACGELCAYCEECLTMGRVRHCSLLISGTPTLNDHSRHPHNDHSRTLHNDHSRHPYNDQPRLPHRPTTQPSAPDLSKWALSPAQTEAAAAGVRFLQQPLGLERAKSLSVRLANHPADLSTTDMHTPQEIGDNPGFLIWAVTGAGKTEMIFPLIETELARGGKVLVATPRRDVVLELEPRLKKAFPDNRVVALYGGSEQRWDSGEITLATTHQLLRFWKHFDLVIIDEIDAFPYHNNPMLEYAARKVCKPTGKYIFLSATPPVHLQRAAKRKKLPHAKVCVRYHRHPLPVPKLVKMKPLRQTIRSGPLLSPSAYKALHASIDRGAQIFVFVPKIKFIESVVADLRSHFSKFAIEGTSSQDTGRRDKVQRFRAGTIRILVTTTILERGVTVPKTDVFILDSDSPLFDEAALVQMSGRAGRSNQDPNGRVYFIAMHKTKSQVKAIKQIAGMNRLAKRKGYLTDS